MATFIFLWLKLTVVIRLKINLITTIYYNYKLLILTVVLLLNGQTNFLNILSIQVSNQPSKRPKPYHKLFSSCGVRFHIVFYVSYVVFFWK